MIVSCRDDPMVCIDWTVLFVAEFLKDWTTMAMLAVMLGLLLKVRSQRQKARDEAYAIQMGQFEAARLKVKPKEKVWDVGRDQWVDQ